MIQRLYYSSNYFFNYSIVLFYKLINGAYLFTSGDSLSPINL